MFHLILSLFLFAVRLVVLAMFTFAFIVLFEHGTNGFVDGAMTEWNLLTKAAIHATSPAQLPSKPGA